MMTQPIEEQVLEVLLDRKSMTLEELNSSLENEAEIPFIINNFIRLGYVMRNGMNYSLTKSGTFCIQSVQNQQAPQP